MCSLQDIKKAETATEKCCLCKVTFAVCFVVSLSLIVGGFFMPPMGVIDGSVLTAVGELLLFPTLLYGYRAVELGMSLKMQHGDTSIEIGKAEDDG